MAKAKRKTWSTSSKLTEKPREPRKGIGLIFPNLDTEMSCLRGNQSGNANELGEVGQSPGESCLFFVRNRVPEIGLPGDRDADSVKHRGSCGVRSALVGP